MNLQEAARLSETEARELLESIRWPNGPVCPHCGEDERAYRIGGEAARAGLCECAACGKQFTVTVGTVMHGSHIALSKWVLAFHSICAHKKGVSALQLQRDLGLGSYRTAWHMAHRIRLAMKEEPLASLLKGQVEVDEAYVGGKPRPGSGEPSKPGRGTKKAPVLALVERGGRVRSKPVERVDGKTLKARPSGRTSTARPRSTPTSGRPTRAWKQSSRAGTTPPTTGRVSTSATARTSTPRRRTSRS